MNLPNFLCIGAQKSGTTLLYELLKDIKDVYLPSTKEIHFFDEESRYSNGLQWYSQSYFKDVTSQKAIGEITPSYLFFEEIPAKILSTIGSKIKFIVILRNPVERAYSHYIMRYKQGQETLSFKDSLIMENSRIIKNKEFARKYSYLSRGFYAKQIENYLQYFDKSQFLFLEFDELTTYQDKSIQKICDFLEIEKTKTITNIKIHSSKLSLKEKWQFLLLNKQYSLAGLLSVKGYPLMNNNVKILLQEYYKDDITKLQIIIQKDLSSWLQ